MAKRPLLINVYDAAAQRIAYVFDNFPRIYISFSGGKDSSVMTHMVCEEARRRHRTVGLLFVDLEAQYKLTIDHVREIYTEYADCIEPYWSALPIKLRNAVSQYDPRWLCWDKSREQDWVRPRDPISISEPYQWNWFREGMEFEEFVPEFGRWYSKDQLCACFVGIRTQESLNRWRSIASQKKKRFMRKCWTTWCGDHVYNCYPIYDWTTEDIWRANGKFGWCYNRLYDRMHQAGLTIHQQRICQPYGDDQRKGLWLFHLIEPETWSRIVARVNGANSGSLYCQDTGNINGTIKISKPEGHSWQSFATLLLESMPPKTQEHYRNKIAQFLHWYYDRGYLTIPDDGPVNDRDKPSWKRICKALLRNDYWCKGLSFSQTKSDAYERYKKIMQFKRQQWNLI